MDRGRKICDVLKAVRKKIADMNDIAYEPRVCHFKGHCSGSCPIVLPFIRQRLTLI